MTVDRSSLKSTSLVYLPVYHPPPMNWSSQWLFGQGMGSLKGEQPFCQVCWGICCVIHFKRMDSVGSLHANLNTLSCLNFFSNFKCSLNTAPPYIILMEQNCMLALQTLYALTCKSGVQSPQLKASCYCHTMSELCRNTMSWHPMEFNILHAERQSRETRRLDPTVWQCIIK